MLLRSTTKIACLLIMSAIVLMSCKVDSDSIELSAYENLPDDIFLDLGKIVDLGSAEAEILVSVPDTVKSLYVCEVNVDDGACSGATESTLVFATDTRYFYKADATVLLEHDLILAIYGKDDSGQISNIRTYSYYNEKDPTPGSGGTGDSTASTGAQPRSANNDPGIVERNTCAVAGCHANYAQFSNGAKADALGSGRMPKGRSILPGDKDTLMRYFQGG